MTEQIRDAIDEKLRKLHFEAWKAGVLTSLPNGEWPDDDEQQSLVRGIDSVAVGEHFQGWGEPLVDQLLSLSVRPEPVEGLLSPYAAVDRDFACESRSGSVSPGRVIREMALNAGIHGAPTMQRILDEVCAGANREHFRAGIVEGALKDLLFALHARPRPGHTLMELEDAIAAAVTTLDDKLYRQGHFA